MSSKPIKDNKKTFIFDSQITTHAIRFSKVDATRILNDAGLFLDIQESLYSYYQMDKICTVYDVYNIESIALGQTVKYFENDFPAVDTKDPFIKEKSDLKKIRNIDFYNNKRCRFVLDLIDRYRETIGSDFKPRFCAPFSLAVNIRGYDNLINDIYNDKKFCDELFKVINHELLSPWINIQKEKIGKDDIIASGADAWVTIPNVDLKIFDEVIIPSFNELQDLVGKIYLSLMGGSRYLKEPEDFLGIQKILNPFQVKGFDPDVEVLGPEMFAGYANKNNMDLLLGIDPNHIFSSSISDIEERIVYYIKTGLSIKKDFILYFNDIPANISRDKLKDIFNIVRKARESLYKIEN